MSIQLVLSVDWEGTSLKEKNLGRIKEFKKRWKIPMVHFLNPAYYTKSDLRAKEVDQKVDSVLEIDDEVGLHLHTPQHLINAAGITPRFDTCFSEHGDYNPGEMKGQEVMLLSYNKSEVKELIEFSINKLKSRGHKQITSFRAGGWMADERVWESLIECGLEIESSATNPRLLDGSSWEGDSLQRYLNLLWDDIECTSSPFFLETFSGKILEVPNNLGAIDYWKENTISKFMDEIKQQHLQGEDLTLVVNSHQETASKEFDKLDNFIETMIENFGEQEISFCTNKEVYQDEYNSRQRMRA
jgi:hypothetical protein